jgi:hypothetical protein
MTSLIRCQEFNGHWDLSQSLAEALGVHLHRLKEAKPGELEDDCWATLLATQFLLLFFRNERDEYELLLDKANTWLTGNGIVISKWEQFAARCLQ